MNTKSPYVSALEDCIKNELFPVYEKYYKQQNMEVPHLSIHNVLNTKKSVAVLFKPPGDLALSSDGRVAKKQNNSP